MPYTNYTANGTTYGNISPAEALQAQTASNAAARAAAEDARSAQMHMLKQSLQGGGGDDFFSPSGPFGIAPKETGAVSLANRNAEVDDRQMRQADMDANAFRSTGLTANAREGLARGAATLEKGQMDIRGNAQDVLKSTLQDYLTGGDKPAGMNPNLQSGFGAGGNPNVLVGGGSSGPNPNVLVGGGTGGGSGGRSSDEQLMKLAILQSIASGGQGGGIGDILKNRDASAFKNREFDMRKAEYDLGMEKTRAEMERWKKDMAEQDSLRNDPTNIAAKYPEVAAPLAQKVAEFVAQDTKVFGWDPTPQDLQAIVQERDLATQGYRKRGMSPDQALQMANRVIVQSLGPNRNDLNSGSTKKLLARIGMGGDSAATPGTGPRMPYLPGL